MVAILLSSKRTDKSDQNLLSLYRETNDKALVGELFNRYSGFVLAICIKYLKDKSESEEITLIIFESLFDKLKRHKVDYFKTWLYSVTKNTCLEHLRKNKNRMKHETDFQKNESGFVEFVPEYHQNEENPVKEKRDEELTKALQSLVEEQRQCLELFYMKGLTYAEIVKETGYALKKVKSYLQNGKRNLRIKLDKTHE
jgi:RNA polymerase sigma-70 factor, ECF subfamily